MVGNDRIGPMKGVSGFYMIGLGFIPLKALNDRKR